MNRGACVIDLASFLLQDPWEEIAQTFRVPIARAGRTMRGYDAEGAMRLMAGVPTQSLERLVRGWDIDSNAQACIHLAHQQGATTVLAADAPHAITEAIARQVGAQATASLVTEVRFGRLTGNLTDPIWEGRCGHAVCLGQVARVSQGQYGRPVTVVSTGRGACACVDAAIVSPTQFLTASPRPVIDA